MSIFSSLVNFKRHSIKILLGIRKQYFIFRSRFRKQSILTVIRVQRLTNVIYIGKFLFTIDLSKIKALKIGLYESLIYRALSLAYDKICDG